MRTAVIVALCALAVSAQTTQGIITGQVYDRLTGQVIPAAVVQYFNQGTGESQAAAADTSGIYAWPNLSPGTYRITAKATGYQSLETSEVRLFVAGRLEIDIPLRPLADVYDQKSYFNGVVTPARGSPADSAGRVIHFYAADIETTKSAYLPVLSGETGSFQAAVSYVIDSRLIDNLPLQGRDVYAMLAIVAGVTSDAPTSRSLGLAVNGQRPSSSNFLLDGVENNNYLVTGPLTTIAPEAVQEYRVSTNSYSAEFGRTGGYLANVVTKAGQNGWHGIVYANVKNDALNASDFQRNIEREPRTPLHEWQPGFFVGGALLPDSLFLSGAFDYLHFSSRKEPRTYRLPTTSFSPAGPLARQLLAEFPGPKIAAVGDYADVPLAAPSTLKRYLALPRADYLFKGGEQRIMGRVALSRSDSPDFLWTPYAGLNTPLQQRDSGVAGSWTGSLPGGFIGEARLGWNVDDLRFDRPHPEVPTLVTDDGTTLPGSPAFHGYHNRSQGTEAVANASKLAGRHILKVGGGLLLRRVSGYLTAARDGQVDFSDLDSFGRDLVGDLRPDRSSTEILLGVSRLDFPKTLVQPDYDRQWSYNQFFLYAQDSFKLTARLVLNYGVRYENYGAPHSTGGALDAVVQLGGGATLADRLKQAYVTPAVPGRNLYGTSPNDWAFRGGASYSPRRDGRTVLRAAYGQYYDRPFDNLWQNLRNNNVVIADFHPQPGFNYLQIRGALASSGIQPWTGKVYQCDQRFNVCDDQADGRLTLYDPAVGSAKIQNFFAAVQQQLGDNLVLEAAGLGSRGRNLVTTDIVNRRNSVAGNPGRFNSDLPQIHYRSGQGFSNYNALTTVVRYRAPRAYFQASYTWSHTIDNQSEPLAGDFYDLRFTGGASQGIERSAAFTRQFDPNVDRGNSDFDQRHNLAFFSVWDVPGVFRRSRGGAVFRDWKFAQLAAVRSGLPYSVTTAQIGELLVHNRPDLVRPDLLFTGLSSVPGGRQLVNPAAFSVTAPDVVGNLGRNVFHGPGFFNLDISLSRVLPLPKLGEGGRLTIRADAFNFLNHANLNNPTALATLLGSDRFGTAYYGRLGRDTGFPAQAPFSETGRQVQLQLRIEF